MDVRTEMESSPDSNVPDSVRIIADSIDRKLAWHFFVFFSRFEYALKRTDYLAPGAGSAQAHWDRFASDHNAKFSALSNRALGSAIWYLKRSPPRKQIRKDGDLAWSDLCEYDPGDPLLVWLLLSVRVVRNNLFHGGKFPQFLVIDSSRDRNLIESAIIVLNNALLLNNDVQHHFNEGLVL